MRPGHRTQNLVKICGEVVVAILTLHHWKWWQWYHLSQPWFSRLYFCRLVPPLSSPGKSSESHGWRRRRCTVASAPARVSAPSSWPCAPSRPSIWGAVSCGKSWLVLVDHTPFSTTFLSKAGHIYIKTRFLERKNEKKNRRKGRNFSVFLYNAIISSS